MLGEGKFPRRRWPELLVDDEPPLRVPDPGFSNGRAVSRRDPRFQVPPDAGRLLTVARIDTPTVPDKLRSVSRSQASVVARAAHPVPLTDQLRLEQPLVLSGKNFLGDERECVRGLRHDVAVTRCQP